MRRLEQEEGLTLIEVLASMVILSIVLFSIMAIFPQMGLSNQKVETKIEGVQLARDVLIEWQEQYADDIQLFFENVAESPTGALQKDVYSMPLIQPIEPTEQGYYFYTNKDAFIAKIKIWTKSDLHSKPNEVHRMHVKIINENHVISETYGYIQFQLKEEVE